MGFPGLTFTSHDLYFITGCDSKDRVKHLVEAFIDEPFVSSAVIDGETLELDGVRRVEVALRPGVTDRVAAQMVASASSLGLDVQVATGAAYDIKGADTLADADLTRLVNNLLSNPVIETWSLGAVVPGFVNTTETASNPIEIIPVRELSPAQLEALNKLRGLALDAAEMEVVQQWFLTEGRDPTDAELETIAQTWSEHCAHKTFTARITAQSGDITPLLRQLRDTTSDINAPFVVSAFDGNAGVVRFSTGRTLAIKAETHNHPSAVEPFGGANTGVGGVVRDILAAPAWPIALTDVLCFGHPDTSPASMPEGVLHPSVIEEGVVAGVADYGNKIGVPTVAGAVVYDPGYVGNPLVFCGCVGEVFRGYARLGTPQVGDRIIVVGGATGRDGIKGATFSSMTMDASTGEVAGASVQIGDPIVERLVGEVLRELLDRDEPLCTALTDCGAGGLSSAVGEMAEELGATVQMRDVERKYPGLAPWEVWLSEAQERMVLSVSPNDVEEVMGACARFEVSATDIGEFTGSSRMVVLDGDDVIVDLPTRFMHKGRPQRHMAATLSTPLPSVDRPRHVDDHDAMIRRLLSHPTIASKEAIVRRYDHEILGSTVIGPMSAPYQTGPSDGVVIARPCDVSGFSLGIGVNPQYGQYDAEAMAWSAVDEAIRNVVVVGADPTEVALLDNFSWGDPRRPETLGDLVLAVKGCCDAARAFRAPFVSGKDSLNNEYEDIHGVRHGIPPTLVITALANVPDVDAVVATTISDAGNVLLVVGDTLNELRGSHLDLVAGVDAGGSVPSPDDCAPDRYARIHSLIRRRMIASAHDVSEGGIAVALAEMVITSPELGIEVDVRPIHGDDIVALYSESNGRIILEVRPQHLAEVRDHLGEDARVIGNVIADHVLKIHARSTTVIEGTALLDAWKGDR